MSHDEHKQTVGMICDALGRKRIAERMGVGKTAVGNAVADGIFPARWYHEIRVLCEESGVECPDELFNFIRTSDDAA